MERIVVELPFGARLVVSLDMDGAVLLIGDAEERFKDLRPLLKQLGALLRDAFRKNFAQGGRPRWRALALSTIARKAALGVPARNPSGRIPWRLKQQGAFGPGNILIAGGQLRDSYVQLGARGHVEVIDEENARVEEGSDLKTAKGAPLAVIHDRGTKPYIIRNAFGRRGLTIRNPGIPARPQTVQDDDVEAMVAATAEYLGAMVAALEDAA